MSQYKGIRLKASTFRSYVDVLVKDGKFDTVKALVPRETAAVMTDQPLASSWIDFRHIIHITQAVESIGGMVGVRDFTGRAILAARKPHLRLVEGVIKLFGTSPATLFVRMNDLVKSTIENLHYTYQAKSERSGVMELRYDTDYEIPNCALVGAIPGLQAILDLCGAEGVIAGPERLGPNEAQFYIQW